MLNIEKRLMQTMDMILAKKKRIALSKRGSKAGFTLGATQGIWNMLRSGKDSDSILYLKKKLHVQYSCYPSVCLCLDYS